MSKKIFEIFTRLKKVMIPLLIVWLIVVIYLIPAFNISVNSTHYIDPNTEYESPFMANLDYALKHPIDSIAKNMGDIMYPKYMFKVQVFTLIYIIGAIYIAAKGKTKSEYDRAEYGSARWARDGEEYRILSKKGGILLSQKHFLPVDKPGNINVLVIGGSGSGKSATFVIPNVLSLLGSYVFTDPKGELYDKTAGYFKQNGYDVKVFNLVTPNSSDGYNPLLNIKSEIDVDIITNTIIRGQGGGSTGGDEYWDNMAEQLLKAIIYLLQERPEEERNLASCAALVRLANSSNNFNMLSELISVLPDEHLAKKAYKNVEIASDKAYSSILSTLQSRLGKFETPEIAALTATNTINFAEIGKKKTAVYVISSDTHATYDFILTIFFSQMIQQLYDYADWHGGQLDVPTYFFLDEFANIGQIPDFDKKISTSRSRKISFNVILQNLDQLEALYEKTFETILANCDTHLFLGSNSQKTVEYFSKTLGEITIEKEQISESKGRRNEPGSISKSMNALGRALMTPDELRRLDPEECIINVKGMYPIRARKYYYFREPAGKKLIGLGVNNRDYKVERGEWREFNVNRKTPEQRLNSLNKLLTPEEKHFLGEEENKTPKSENAVMNLKVEDIIEETAIGVDVSKKEIKQEQATKTEQANIPLDIIEVDEGQITKTENRINNSHVEFNLEKEIGAKFDELFK